MNNEVLYQLSINVAKRMYHKNIISYKDFEEINKILLEKYKPPIGELFSLNNLLF